MPTEAEEEFARLEAIGEAEVRFKVASGKWSGTQAALAKQWLEMEASAKRDAREAETLSIAKDANSIALIARDDARCANKIAITAIVFTIVIAIATAIISVMFGRQ